MTAAMLNEQQTVIADTVARQTSVTDEMNRSVAEIMGNVDRIGVVDRFRH